MSVLDNLSFLKEEKKNNIQVKLLKETAGKNLTHAFLFSGNNSDFLYQLALRFAAFINCENGGCGKCNICKNTLKGIYANLFIAEPEGTILTVDIIKEIQRFSSRSSYKQGKKIIILKEAEAMNEEAANKFLKTLEEPPDKDCIYMLLAEDKSQLISTIVSRCTEYSWNFIEDDTEKIIDFKKLARIIDDGIKEIIRGERAKTLDISIKIGNFISEFEKDIKKEMAEEIKKAEQNEEPEGYINLLKDRQKRKIARLKKKITEKAFDRIISWAEDMASFSLGADKKALNNKVNISDLENINKLKIEKIFKASEIIEKNRLYLKSSINYQLALDSVLLNIANSIN